MRKFSGKQIIILIGVGMCGGVINGLFGAGAGLLLVPLIKLVSKLDEKKVHATTLSCVMLMCVVSSVIFLVNKQVDFRLTLWCLIGSLIGSIIGTVLLQKFKNKVINFIFSGLLIVAGVLMVVL
jgi:uncharacterized membrane protein YfcA